MQVSFSGNTVGSEKHNNNQDTFFIDEDNRAAAVFDGVGGSKLGGAAAILACDFVQDEIKKGKRNIAEILKDASKEVAGTYRGSGTTAALVIMADEAVHMAHAGDSRVWKLVGGSDLLQMTLDHGINHGKGDPNVWKDQLRMSQIKREDELSPDIRHHFEQRNVVTSCLGMTSMPPVITERLANVSQGDKYLLTTDGIHDNLTHDEIRNIIVTASGEQAIDLLIEKSQERANQPIGPDNIRSKPDDMTAVLLEFK